MRLEPLLEHMPGRPRAAAEVGLVVGVVLGPHLAPPGAAAAIFAGTLLLFAFLVLEPWAPRYGTSTRRAVRMLAIAASVVLPALATRPEFALVARHLFVALCVRAVLVVGLVLSILGSDGQSPRQLGVVKAGAWRDLTLGLPATALAFAANFVAAVPIALLKLFGDFGQKILANEFAQRKDVFQHLTGSVSLGGFAAAMVFTASFEEVVFRGFLLPRVRHLVGSWTASVLAVNVVFGLGHLYEGPIAVFQTAVLGVAFSLLFLARGRLLTVAVAHAGFNVIMFALATWLMIVR